MSVIVEHTPSRNLYVLLGTGFGAYQSTKPNWFFGNWMADRETGSHAMVAVCDGEGRIGWFDSHELRVVEIDGEVPADVLG